MSHPAADCGNHSDLATTCNKVHH